MTRYQSKLAIRGVPAEFSMYIDTTELDLETVTVVFRVVPLRKTCEAEVTSPGHITVENLVVAHASGSHSPR